MIKRWRWGSWRFSISAAQVVDVKGVNSILPDGHHVLMWDFDEQDEHVVDRNLTETQQRYRLPTIYVAWSGKRNHWIAICLKRCRFREALQIMASTPGIDVSFLKYGIYRGHWTLRVTPKGTRKIQPAYRIISDVYSDVDPFELQSFVKYESTNL